MRHRVSPCECSMEKLLIGLDSQYIRLDAVRISNHTVRGYDGIAFDAVGARQL